MDINKVSYISNIINKIIYILSIMIYPLYSININIYFRIIHSSYSRKYIRKHNMHSSTEILNSVQRWIRKYNNAVTLLLIIKLKYWGLGCWLKLAKHPTSEELLLNRLIYIKYIIILIMGKIILLSEILTLWKNLK